MFTIDEFNDEHNVRVDETYSIELPVIFRAVLKLRPESGVSLTMQDNVLWIARPEVQYRMQGAAWSRIKPTGMMEIPPQFSEALNAAPGDYLLLSIFQAQNRISAMKKPPGCDICRITDLSQFTTSDLICDRCYEEIIKSAKEHHEETRQQ